MTYQIIGGSYDKPIKHVILGFVKCGTCSLQKYYREKYPDFECIRVETVWREDGMEQWEQLKKEHPQAIPVIITRDIKKAIWSYFWYFKTRPKDMKFKDFLSMPINHHQHGKAENIFDGYNFDKWIKKWEKHSPIVVSLEEINKLDNFNNVNKASEKPLRKRKYWGWKDDKYPTITQEEIMLIDKGL